MELLGAVNFNSGIALIVDERKPVTYERKSYRGKGKYTADLLIGDNEDGMVDVLQRHVYSCGPKAFGGHKFSWKMKDGTVMTTDGWWWSGGYTEAEELLGRKIVSLPISSLSDLCMCYVFCSASMFADSYHILIDAYCEKHGRPLELLDYWAVDRAINVVKHRMPEIKEPHALWDAVCMCVKADNGGK